MKVFIVQCLVLGDARFKKDVVVLDTFNGEVVATLGSTFWLMHVPTRIAAVAYIVSVETKGDFSVDVEVSSNILGLDF